MDLLFSPSDLREVVAPVPVSSLPGRPRGIQGVVIHQGEFLPVLAWEELPGSRGLAGPPTALAVLRPRLGILLERLEGMVELPHEAWRECDEADPKAAWSGAVGRVGNRDFHRVDTDRLIALLRRFRGEH
jgi:chemotaxis signal transduction protein